jgi:lysophospholipase L1-like esterase
MQIIEKIKAKQMDLKEKPAVTIAFLGDSVTQGCFDVYLQASGGIETYFDQENSYHRHLAKLLAMLYPTVPFNMINAGISGSRASQGLQRLEQDVLSHNPDLVVVCFGLNDCGAGAENVAEYTNALREIFARLRSAGTEVIFMTPNMMCTQVSDHIYNDVIRDCANQKSQLQNEGVLDLYMSEAKKVCAENGVPVCDCYAKWQQLYQNGVNVTELLANKINHPTKEMNWLFAISLLEQMMQ